MPSLFGKASPHPVQYRQLDQKDLSDSDINLSEIEDEDEKIVFRKPGDLELNLYPDNKSDILKRELEKARCRKTSGIAVIVTMATIVVIGLIVRFHSQYHEQTIDQSLVWKIILDDFMTENGLVLMDVDGDNIDDLIFSAIQSSVWNGLIDEQSDGINTQYQYLHKFCQRKGLEYPCEAVVFALRGFDGKELWRLKTRANMLNINCEEFDLDRDGRIDCIGTGRKGIITAFNPYTGKQIWSVENDTVLKAEWNTYQALPLPDFDQDGVLEILIANGGNPKMGAKEKNRAAGRLVVLSGAKGIPLGNGFLELPDSKETYMSPILYQQTNGSTPYILVGTGGETIPGDLMGISVGDLCHAIFYPSISLCPPSKDLPWPQLTKNDEGVFVIYKGKRKGVMVPPVIIDVDQDGMMDIVASVFDGAVLLFDGKTMRQKWKAEFSNMESYSTPAPGHFDEDNIIDFMMHWNRGTWKNGYNETLVSVISGKTGELLWQTKSPNEIQTSDLVIRGNDSNHDYFLFRQTYMQDESHNQKHKRHMAGSHTPKEPHNGLHEHVEDFFMSCQNQYPHPSQQMLLVDRSTMQAPFKVLNFPIKEVYYEPKYCAEENIEGTTIKEVTNPTESQAHHVANHQLLENYTETVEPSQQPGPSETSAYSTDMAGVDKQSSTIHIRQRRSHKEYCALLKPFSGSTGALGDVDGDGMLDYVNILYYSAAILNTCLQSDNFKVQTAIHVVALEKQLISMEFEAVTLDIDSKVSQSDVDKQHNVAFLPRKQQKWTKYMGTKGNNWYM